MHCKLQRNHMSSSLSSSLIIIIIDIIRTLLMVAALATGTINRAAAMRQLHHIEGIGQNPTLVT